MGDSECRTKPDPDSSWVVEVGLGFGILDEPAWAMSFLNTTSLCFVGLAAHNNLHTETQFVAVHDSGSWSHAMHGYREPQPTGEKMA